MRELLQEVLTLQSDFSSQNTPAMQVRGNLIRNVIPEELRRWRAVQPQALLPFRGRLNVQGRDGTGLKTFVPWVRIRSPEMSPSAQSGWYVVYLFRQDGTGVALCVSHGSTRFDGREFKPRTAEEAASLMAWGRALIRSQAFNFGMVEGVDLGSAATLSKAYESTTAFSKTYAANAVPDDATLAREAERAVALIAELYRAQELGRAPDAPPPELIEADNAVSTVSRPGSTRQSSKGQGFGLSAPERKAVEAHAMSLAAAWLAANGFTAIRDVHAAYSCDYLATRNGVEHHVEVKGTTSPYGKVILTANEVELHRRTHPTNLLIVVHGIDLIDARTKATGGEVTVLDPLVIENCTLTPLSFACLLP
ncbi:MrcB family domain-containing protein [Sphingomonas lenta]|uniref:Type IV methyl-directed restriction enzyme EcoKMcrB subunit DNA-binding domain-containing protein n=1 Tax=Sphingomonas lenta TaxID=1141887 RepID=A0A2A2SBS6_9SPHN|nr:DUF3578 domain-containing protein [Sphingomonas lenta]PAX06673.1 hypothetical protein CKY28_16190 [Sphingomonas lenta]